MAYGNYVTLSNLGLKIPQISPFASDDSVDNKTTMPYLLKLSVATEEYFSNAFIFIKSLGWTNVVVLATDDNTHYNQYLYTVAYAFYSGVKIVNPSNKQMLPWNYTRNDFYTYKSYFQAAKDTGCRIFIIVCYDRGLI